jgi:hypothetical protein
MKRQREIVRGFFAMLLVAIYSIATISSSAAILFCEHPHHHHHHESHNHDHECECDGLRFVAECCDHHHSLLGENHTDYITTEQRHDSRSANLFTLLLQPHVATIVDESLQTITPSVKKLRYGDEYEPLRAALIEHTSLRAPPVVA